MSTRTTSLAGRAASRRGFFLIEMIVVLALLAVFALVATRLLHTTLLLPHKIALAQESVQRLDSAVRRMRRDVWSASSLHCPDDHTLEIEGPLPIVWRVEKNGNLTRTPRTNDVGGAEAENWEITDQRITLSADSLDVMLRLSDAAGNSDQVEMASEIALLKRGKP